MSNPRRASMEASLRPCAGAVRSAGRLCGNGLSARRLSGIFPRSVSVKDCLGAQGFVARLVEFMPEGRVKHSMVQIIACQKPDNLQKISFSILCRVKSTNRHEF